MNNYYVTTYDTLNCVWVEVEVTEEVYRAYKKTEWDIENDERRHRKFETVFSELDIPEEEMDKKELFVDYTADPAERMMHIFLAEKLNDVLSLLDTDEKELIKDLIYKGFKQTECAEKYGITQGTVSKRKKKILKKMKEILEKDEEWCGFLE